MREIGWTSISPGPLERSRSEEHTSELQSRSDLVCRLLLDKKKTTSVVVHEQEIATIRSYGQPAVNSDAGNSSVSPWPDDSRSAATARLMYSFFLNETATTEIYTLSLHDALPI